MAIKPKSCFEVACDGGCEDVYEEGTPHFPSKAEAIEWAESCKWLIIGDQAWCPSCAVKKECEATDHLWPEDWDEREYQGVSYRLRYCERCTEVQYDPPIEEVYVLVDTAAIINGTDQG